MRQVRFFSIASGSKGNCVCVENGGTAVLIDAGISPRRVREVLRAAGIPSGAVKGVFVTHEHSDHIKYLKNISSAVKSHVFANMKTIEAICEKEGLSACSFYELPVGGEADMGALSVTSFKTSHDAAESVGYVITDGSEKLAVCTDTGKVTREASEAIIGSKLVYIESNHDENMLVSGNYPAYLKDRIMSSRGHLSNTECGCSCEGFVKSGSEHIILAHISEENNTPELCVSTVSGLISVGGAVVGRDCTVEAAGQHSPSSIYEI